MFKKDYLFKRDFIKKTKILCKAQIAIVDLFIALFAATILIILIMFVWNRYSVLAEENINYNDLQTAAFQAANILVKSGGEPENWEEDPNNVEIVGLANNDRNLSIAKVNALINLSYNITSKALGVELYNFYFQLKHINGTKIAGYGRNVSNFVINVPRLVWYKNEKAIMEFALWI